MTATFAILTPTGASGAIAIIEVAAASAGELNAALDRIGLRSLRPGAFALRDLMGVDRGIAARWSDSICHLMPHGGVGIVRKLASRLVESGFSNTGDAPYPESDTALESRMLASLSRAASPLAIDLLLDQPRRWASGQKNDATLDRELNRLLSPPLVVARGPANIGKSTLVNALAGKSVSIVADEPGTTRDHVGVLLDLAGLVVRYLDTPGVRKADDPIEREAAVLAERAALQADLVLLMGDAESPPLPLPAPAPPSIRIALRHDRGEAPWPADVRVSAHTGWNLALLAEMVRESLVSRGGLTDPRPWRFWADSNPARP